MFEYFPTNYIWSLGVAATLNSGGAIDEVDRACRPIREAAERGDAGTRDLMLAWKRVADQVAEQATEAEKAGHLRTAGQKYFRAAAYVCQAERMLSSKDPERIPFYQQGLDLMQKSFELIDPATTRVEVPFEGDLLPAYFTQATRADGSPAPTMIMWNGLDSTKEHMYTSEWPKEMAARGISTLMVDCPGSGEALRFLGLKSRVETEDWAKACVDYLETRDDVDADRIGLVGWSLGGYYAPRAAAYEKRIKLVVAWGANHNWGEVQKKRLEREGENPVPHYWEHVLWVWGGDDIDTFIKDGRGGQPQRRRRGDHRPVPDHPRRERPADQRVVRPPVLRPGGQQPQARAADLHARGGRDRARRARPPAARRRVHRGLDRGHVRRDGMTPSRAAGSP